MNKIIITLIAFLCLFINLPTSVYAQTEKPVLSQESDTLPENSETYYGIGSVSKVFTAAAAMKLVEDGMLDLDEPLTTYLPEFQMADERYPEITLRMLLNHSSGLMGMTDNNAWLMGDNDTYHHDHFLEYLSTQTLKHNPGETSIYCNDGFTLAEILVERVSGISFTEFIEQNFSQRLGLEHIKTPQSKFDLEQLAAVYLGSNEMKSENLNVIGSGGIYASMADLCKFSTIFMDSADGSVLSKEAVHEMAANQHKKPIIGQEADTTFAYGLGWDGVDIYPYRQYGIKSLSKGGATGMYHTNLTVLPEHNLAVAVTSSGQDSYEQLIAQEIILEILKEEGLIDDTDLALPEPNTMQAKIPEKIKDYAGLYDGGQGYLIHAEFTDYTLVLTPIGIRNEQPQHYIYNTDGLFLSTNGDYINTGAFSSAQDGTRGITTLEFRDDKYIVAQTYEILSGLSQSAFAMPIAEKVEPNEVPDAIKQSWKEHSHKEYLLINEKYSSFEYIHASLAKINADDRTPGYVGMGIYQGLGKSIKTAKIINENLAVGYQSTPTMTGRDTNNLTFEIQDGMEILNINNYKYVDATSISEASAINGIVQITSGAVWFQIDEESSGQNWHIQMPENGSWFTYDSKMNCVASSLEKNSRDVVTLPDNGRIVFVGEPGVTFVVTK